MVAKIHFRKELVYNKLEDSNKNKTAIVTYKTLTVTDKGKKQEVILGSKKFLYVRYSPINTTFEEAFIEEKYVPPKEIV